MIGTGFLSRLSSGPTMLARGRLVLEGQPRPFPAAFVERLGRGVLGEVLVGAVGAQHVGRAHAADAAVVAVVRRAGRIVGRQVVERRGDARGVEVVPERDALAPEHGLGRLVVERPEVELEPVVAHLPGPLAGHGLGGRVKRGALLLRMAVDEVEDPVRAGPRAVDEVGPGDGALRRRARAQLLKPPPARSFSRLGSRPAFIMLSESRGSIPSMPMTITFLPEAPRDVAAATQPVVSHAQPGGTDGPAATAAEPLQQGPAVYLGDGCDQPSSDHLVPGPLLVRAGPSAPASPTVSTLPSM